MLHTDMLETKWPILRSVKWCDVCLRHADNSSFVFLKFSLDQGHWNQNLPDWLCMWPSIIQTLIKYSSCWLVWLVYSILTNYSTQCIRNHSPACLSISFLWAMFYFVLSSIVDCFFFFVFFFSCFLLATLICEFIASVCVLDSLWPHSILVVRYGLLPLMDCSCWLFWMLRLVLNEARTKECDGG